MFADLVTHFDERADRLIEPLRGRPGADRIFYTASALGDFGLLWVVFALLRALRGGKKNERAAIRGIVATGVESVLVNVILKSFFGRGRPLEQRDHPLPLRQPRSSSFPSGHTTAAFCGAVLLSEDDPFAAGYFVAAGVISLSRMYVKAHHASDVAGGVGVGLFLGWVGRRLFRISRDGELPTGNRRR
jgi:undecaprenyl-diphosphatase